MGINQIATGGFCSVQALNNTIGCIDTDINTNSSLPLLLELIVNLFTTDKDTNHPFGKIFTWRLNPVFMRLNQLPFFLFSSVMFWLCSSSGAVVGCCNSSFALSIALLLLFLEVTLALSLWMISCQRHHGEPIMSCDAAVFNSTFCRCFYSTLYSICSRALFSVSIIQRR